MKSVMSTTFLQQILCSRMLLAVTSRQENNFNSKFKLKTYNDLLTKICCENIVDITLF